MGTRGRKRKRETRREASYFLTYASQPDPLYRCPQDHSDVARTRREQDTCTRQPTAGPRRRDDLTRRPSRVASPSGNARSTDEPRESRDETGRVSFRSPSLVSAVQFCHHCAARRETRTGTAGHTREIALIDVVGRPSGSSP